MRRAARLATVFTLALALAPACGYRSVHGGSEEGERFTVVLATSNVPDATAADEVVAGVREELARAGALEGGGGYPRCEIEVLRADEASEGVAAVRNPDGVLMPAARATRIGIVARAWIVREKDGPRERDTGDVRALETVAAAGEARTAAFGYADALRAAGRRAGRRMGARILGLPAAGE